VLWRTFWRRGEGRSVWWVAKYGKFYVGSPVKRKKERNTARMQTWRRQWGIRHLIFFEGCLTVYLPHEIKWNVNLMQLGDFVDVFLARHAVARHHPHRTHDLHSGSQDHHPSPNSVQKTICCNSTSSAPDDGRMYPKHVELRIHEYNYLVAWSWYFTLFNNFFFIVSHPFCATVLWSRSHFGQPVSTVYF